MKLELADIATNEKHLLNGFKVFGIFPFYLRFIRTDTHIQLSKIREQIHQIAPEPKISDFDNYEIQQKATPLINEYCLTGLINNRKFGWLYRKLLEPKIKACNHSHILNLYVTIKKLDDPGFFLAYWKDLNLKDNTLLSEVKQS
jgi:hypothetical protein